MFSIIQAAGWPIWPLILCSILGLALIIERSLSLQTVKVTPPNLLSEVLRATRRTMPSSDVIGQLEQNSPLGEILAAGLRTAQARASSSIEEMQEALHEAIEGTGRLVAHKLERYLSALATIASVAPLLGLFGTVIGMIEIFGAQAPTNASGGGNPAQLAHGISIALYNTAFGLVIAIPTLVFWRYFRARVDAHLLALELAGERLVQHLVALRHGHAGNGGSN